MQKINSPLIKKDIERLKAGDKVLLSGTIYTARDQAHTRIIEAIKAHKNLPFAINNQVIYYCGPTKAPQGKSIGTSTSLSADGERRRIIGSCGPTTSKRMDDFTPPLLKLGLKGMIGKGSRSDEVASAIKRYRAVYFLTYAGCGALLTKYIKEAKAVAYKELGPEAVYRLRVKDFPLIVAIDSQGRDVYKGGLR